MNPRIVCAANKYGSVVVIGIRHYDRFMNARIRDIDEMLGETFLDRDSEIQGFVDQFGNFYTREEAFVIAEKENQIIRECGNPGSRKLYSEHLY